MEAKEILALDVGKTRTGVARASSLAKIAEPLKTLPTDKVLEEISNMGQLEAVVVGLPRSLGGDDTQQTRWVRKWVAAVKPQVNTPMFWVDEALSTVKASELKSQYKNADEDSLAATILLQDFLNTPKPERLRC